MKKQYYFPYIMSLLFSTSALFAQKSVYTFPFDNSYRLPSMQTQVNSEEISATYQTLGNIYTTEITGIGDDKMQQTSMSYISDARVVDAVRFLEFYMDEHLVAPGDESSGLMEMSIIYYHEYERINAGSILGYLTFGLGFIFGIPRETVVVDVETKASFYDRLVAIHRGVGQGKKLQTIYNTNTRRVHQRALRNAIKRLNTNIMNDPALNKIRT